MFRDLNVDQIKKLWILDLIIKQGSLKKASLQAKVSPSAISQTLSSLEQTFGRPMLIREKGSVTPTLDAVAILEVVRPAFEAFERLRNINETPVPKISWMSFGPYESIAIDILPGLIHAFKIKLPNMRLSMRISRTANLLTMVRKGELCSALISEVDDLGRFYTHEAGKDRLGVFISNKHQISSLGWRATQVHGVGSLSNSKDGLPKYYTKFLRQYDSSRQSKRRSSFKSYSIRQNHGRKSKILADDVKLKLPGQGT